MRFFQRVAIAMLSLALGTGTPALAAPQQIELPAWAPGHAAAVPISYAWDDDWLAAGGYSYQHGLARIAGAIAMTAYLQPYGGLTNLFAALGCDADAIADYHYGAVEEDFPDKSGYSFAARDFVSEKGNGKLVIVAIRGTTGLQEWQSNANIANSTGAKQRYHEGFAASARLVVRDLAAYLAAHGLMQDSTHILVTGHSRGAAVANLVGAFLDRGELGSMDMQQLLPSHIHVYAFAPANTCTAASERRSALYRNVFNIVNPEDPVPELPFRGGSWGYGKYGVTFTLPSAFNMRGDPAQYQRLLHAMAGPFAALTGGKTYAPMPSGEKFARNVKNLQWLVGTVDRYYRGRSRPSHANTLKSLSRSIPVEDDDRQPETYYGSWASFAQQHPQKIAAMEDAHGPATYDAWLLSGEPEEIYRRGTPTRVEVRAIAEDGADMGRVTLLRGKLPFDADLALPGDGAETVAAAVNGKICSGELPKPVIRDSLAAQGLVAQRASRAPKNTELSPVVWTDPADAALRVTGHKLLSFSVPEGEELRCNLTARDGVTLLITTHLEATKENGIAADAGKVDGKQLLLKKGERMTFDVSNRQIVRIRNS